VSIAASSFSSPYAFLCNTIGRLFVQPISSPKRARMTSLFQRMIEDMQIRNLALGGQQVKGILLRSGLPQVA
jgi:hypothetical protein